MTVPHWPRKKWFYAVGLVFAFQLGLIMFLGERGRELTPPRGVRTAIRLAVDPWAAQQALDMPALSDPAAFALPNWNGFSRDGWLAFARPEFRLSDWTEPPQWLTLDTGALGTTLHYFILSNTMAPLLIADKPLPRLTGQDSVANAPAPSHSELSIEGELANWSFAADPELPSWPHTDLLTNTVVHALVDARGSIIATAILAGSGSPEADQFAERTTKAARFRPATLNSQPSTLNPQRWVSGKLVFKWHTVPSTNIVATVPAAGP